MSDFFDGFVDLMNPGDTLAPVFAVPTQGVTWLALSQAEQPERTQVDKWLSSTLVTF